jgi:hypothetical protein
LKSGYSCQCLKRTSNANTVTIEAPGAYKYIQINPSINQDSRLNFHFARPDGNNTIGWTPANEWEQPILRWQVVNYADYGLQISLPNELLYSRYHSAAQQGWAFRVFQLGVGRGCSLPSGRNGLRERGDGREGTRFMALLIAKVDNTPRFKKGPYVASEGICILRQPLSKPDGVGRAWKLRQSFNLVFFIIVRFHCFNSI